MYLTSIIFSVNFKYHLNNCYKNYTYVMKNEWVPEKNVVVDDENNDNFNFEKRYSKRLKLDFSISEKKCIICNQMKKKQDKVLHEIQEEDVAKNLFDATRYLLDDTFTMTLNFSSADFLNKKYHKQCMRSYLYKYETQKSKQKNSTSDENSTVDPNFVEYKQDVNLINDNNIIYDVIKSIESEFFLGKIYSLTDVSRMIKEKNGSSCQFQNKKIKLCLIDYFNQNVAFIYPKKKKLNRYFFIIVTLNVAIPRIV